MSLNQAGGTVILKSHEEKKQKKTHIRKGTPVLHSEAPHEIKDKTETIMKIATKLATFMLLREI
jgi:hypothetical protein